MNGKEAKSLDVRIEELEKKLDKLTRTFEPADITAEEMRAFTKVAAAFGWEGGGACGLNECMRCSPGVIPRPYGWPPIRPCIPTPRPCIPRCINECTCGPGGGWSGGGGDFGNLGG